MKESVYHIGKGEKQTDFFLAERKNLRLSDGIGQFARGQMSAY